MADEPLCDGQGQAGALHSAARLEVIKGFEALRADWVPGRLRPDDGVPASQGTFRNPGSTSEPGPLEAEVRRSETMHASLRRQGSLTYYARSATRYFCEG